MIRCGISEDEEFLVTFPGANSFAALLEIMRKYGGKFNHNKRTLTGDNFSKAWVFDSHLAKIICEEIKDIEPRFLIPSWTSELNSDQDKDFVKFRAAIDPACVKSEWAGDFQRKGVLRGITQNRLALYWEMGLGKSFTIQTILNHLICWQRVNKYIILSPPEGVINIALECIRFSSFNLTWDDIYIVDTTHRNPFDYPEKKVIIMTYRNLIMLHDDEYKRQKGKRGSSVIRKNYIPWEKLGDKLCMIADEAHNIKNSRSKTWHILDKAKRFFEYRYIMTGTPAPKYAADLWTQMRFLHEKSVASDYYSFLRSIANLGNRFSDYTVNFYYEDRVKDFLDSVEYLISREKTAGNLELPPVVYEPIRIQMPPKQERLYRAIVDLTITTIKKGEDGRVTLRKLHNKFPYLSLALHDPCIIQEGKIEESQTSQAIVSMLRNWDITENGKYEVAKSLIEKYADEDRKIILWSGHPKIIDLLTEKFKEFNPYKLHGGVVVNKGESVSERNATICNAFITDKNSNLLIANYDCLSSAVNLVEVTRMIFYDRSWEADIFNQALKRANRIGSREPLIVNPLIFFNSIEEYQDREIIKRTNFNNALWDGGKGGKDVLDNRDILTLDDCREILAGTMTK
jgi:SNF2 family DNA or RNA helicase